MSPSADTPAPRAPRSAWWRRPSTRTLVLLSFLAITGLLVGVAASGLYTLEQLTLRSRELAVQDGQAHAAVQQLAERHIAMERAARQFLVLDDALLLQRFEEAAADAARLVRERIAPQTGAATVRAWQARLTAIRRQLPPPASLARERVAAGVTADFRELQALGEQLAQQVRAAGEARNDALQKDLETGRARLAQQLAAALALTLAVSLSLGVWLTRPLRRLEQAIAALGGNRLDEPVDVAGPADLRALGRQLEWLRLRLSELDADQARFLRHVSHELKTPLAALREGVSLLQDGVAGPLSADQREVARILQHNTDTLQRHIEALLRFNAAAFEARTLHRQPTPLRALLEGLVAEQQLQWQAGALRVEVSGPACTADVDPQQLGRALSNLLSNAIRFSPPGGTVRLQLCPHNDGSVQIDVADAGPGVAAGDRARVFEPFYRGERQPGQGLKGSGLGLSIVHECITAHGGQVRLLADAEASALPGALAGAHFRITLPRALV